MTARLLNIGCGATLHPEWLNVDLEPLAPGVQRLDVRQPLPFADGSFNAVYCSHVLEHLRREDAARLLAGMRRVLRPAGVIRLAVPDLEAIAREYVAILDAMARGEHRAKEHEWIVLEMFDQFARDESGGAMADYLADPARGGSSFVRARVGEPAAPRGGFHAAGALRALRQRLARWAAAAVGGRAASDALREGYFRQSGEVHRWMYDAYSLKRALSEAGFVNVQRRTAFESAIPGFDRYRLDVDEAGNVRKPDSLFMEAQAA